MAACASNDTTIVCEYIEHVKIYNRLHKPSYLIDKVVNEGSYYGYTPLHFAAKFGQFDNVEQLLRDGAYCFVMTADNLTPLIVALKNGHDNICLLLLADYKARRMLLFYDYDDQIDVDGHRWAECDKDDDDELFV